MLHVVFARKNSYDCFPKQNINRLFAGSGLGGMGAGGASTPSKVFICRKSGQNPGIRKIPGNLDKQLKNTGKNGVQPKLFDFETLALNLCRIT